MSGQKARSHFGGQWIEIIRSKVQQWTKRVTKFEEFRTVTLMRTNKLVERVRKHNPMYNGLYATNGIEEYHSLYPIPADEIENNSEAVLEQNPGY